MEHSGRNGGIRNERGGFRRRRPATENVSNQPSQEQNIENSENKQKSRRRFNRNRKSKNNNNNNNNNTNTNTTTEQSKDDGNAESLLLTESNLTTLLSELNMGNKTLNTANSTSSESLDFEKINTEDTDANLCGIALSSASSRLAASFNKGN